MASVLLASEEARAQTTVGPGLVTTPITGNRDTTVVGSTQLIPSAGSVAVFPGGNAIVTFNPGLVEPGPISVATQNATAIIIGGGTQLAINPNAAPFLTTITTTGPNAYGIDITSGNHTELLNNVVITTSGVNSDGIRVENPNNTVNATNVTVTTTGAGASALALLSGGGSTASFANSTLTSETGPVIRVQGGSGKTINLTDTSVTAGSGDGRWLYVTGGAINTNVTASQSTLTGAAITDSGSTSNLTLTNGTVWTMSGKSNATNVTNNNSEIIYTPPTGDPTQLSSYKTLTANNYGGTGGTIALNTFLGNDSSPSDRLVINGGTATGSTSLRILNTTGPGDQTVSNGILVVQTIGGGTTVPGAFSLAGEVRGGAYDYFLFRGGLGGSAPNDWFLRSSFDVPPVQPPIVPPVEPPPEIVPPPVLPPDPPPSVLPPGQFPIIGPELATYGVVQPIARQMGLTTLGTLHERVGDAAAGAACLNNATFDSVAITKAPPTPDNCRQAVWGRMFGQQINNHYQAFADPRASGQVAGIQTGVDVWRGSLIPGHSDTAGLYFAYSNGNVSVDGLVTNAAATAYILQHTGSLNLNAFSFGGYWTHYGPTGWYIDAVLQGSLYQGDASTQFASLPTNGTGFTSSLETGYPIPLPWFGPRFVLEPEAQIIWQRVSFDDANDGLGPVALGTTSGASGRLGLRGKWTINDPAGRVWQPYMLANVWRDWGAQANTMFGPDSVLLAEQSTRLEFAGGLSAKILSGLTLYAQAGYQFAVSGTDGGRRDGVKGNFGVHYAW